MFPERVKFSVMAVRLRIRLDGLLRCWYAPPSGLCCIEDVCNDVVTSFQLQQSCPNGVDLFMDGFPLPPSQPLSLLNNNDLVSVQPKTRPGNSPVVKELKISSETPVNGKIVASPSSSSDCSNSTQHRELFNSRKRKCMEEREMEMSSITDSEQAVVKRMKHVDEKDVCYKKSVHRKSIDAFHIPRSPWLSFAALISILSKQLPAVDLQNLHRHYFNFKMGHTSREEMVRTVRQIAGHTLLVDAMKTMQRQLQVQLQVQVQVPSVMKPAETAPPKVEKVKKKDEEGVQVNVYKPKTPYVGRCLLNTKIVGDDAPGETKHMVFSTEGKIPYREGQSLGVIPPGNDGNGKPHKLRLYSIASSAPGDFGDNKTVSLCVKRLVYVNDKGEEVKGVCSNFLCDLKPGDEVTMTGPVGKEMLMPVDPNATIIMLATGTGIAPFRAFLWRMFFEKHENYEFNGLAWLFLGVPTSSSLLYKEEFEKMKEKAGDKFRLDFAVSREQKNDKGEKMYIQTRMAEYAEELWGLLKKDNTYVYMCGLKGMEKGIDDIMLSLAARDGIDWIEYKKQLKRGEQWNVEVY